MQIDKTVINIPPVIKNGIKTEGASIGVKTEEASVKEQVVNVSSNELSDKMTELKKFAAHENKAENILLTKKEILETAEKLKTQADDIIFASLYAGPLTGGVVGCLVNILCNASREVTFLTGFSIIGGVIGGASYLYSKLIHKADKLEKTATSM